MTVITDLRDKVKIFYDNQTLVELTTDSTSTSTSINDTRLEASCEYAIGDFEMRTGKTADPSNRRHLAVLQHGVIYYLEVSKSRNAAIMSFHKSEFASGCNAFKNRLVFPSRTTSTLSPSKEASGSRPDMDRNSSALNPRRRSATTRDFEVNRGS